MDDLRHLITVGEQLATTSLKGGKWDTEAFLVLSVSELLKRSGLDLVPESQIDEKTDISKDLFISYMKNRTVGNLQAYLSQIHQIISELYHTVQTDMEREVIKNSVANLEKIW